MPWVETSDLLLQSAARFTRLYHNTHWREDCMSVRPCVLSAYLYDYTCILILLLLCNLCSPSLCSCCLYFATAIVIYTLGSGFNLDVKPPPLPPPAPPTCYERYFLLRNIRYFRSDHLSLFIIKVKLNFPAISWRFVSTIYCFISKSHK